MWISLGGRASCHSLPCLSRHFMCQEFSAASIRLSSDSARRAEDPREVNVEHLQQPYTGVAVIRMNRPRYRNALGMVFLDQLTEAFSSLHFDKTVKVVIVKSDIPKIFCAGADLKERYALTDDEYRKSSYRLRNHMSNALINLPMPTIAAVDGAAMGGGLELALACDVRVVGDNAKIGLVETTLGIIPGAAGTQTLPRNISTSSTKEMVFTGIILNGREAHARGIFNSCVTQNEAGDAAFLASLGLAREIIPHSSTFLRATKYAINKGMEVNLGSGLMIEEGCLSQVIHDPDPDEDTITGRSRNI